MIETTVTLSDGRALRASETGAGADLVVLLHGWTCRRGHWDAFLEGPGRDYHCLAPDLPGHGDSATTDGVFSVAGLAADVADLVASRRPARVVLVGHSMGGAVAMEAATRLPDVAAVVLVDTFVIPYGDLAEADASAIERGFREDFESALDRLVDTNAASGMRRGAKDELANGMKETNPARMLPLWSDLLRWDPEPAFQALRAPLLAINGDLIPDASRRRCAGRVDEQRLPGAGHFPQLEMPEVFNRALEDILRRVQ
ncbi:alpha/beta fold hydrolase [Alloalcanivorax sp. C16-2]|uniref:alpha/beta fold hydrolase n=1 Tax=Alloalcanivorax sp. C16-2 TaxID=3390052 RepID=UPI003970B83F